MIENNYKKQDAENWISKAAKNSDEILLATDPDREGEAIAWHILEVLNAKKIIKGKKTASFTK